MKIQYPEDFYSFKNGKPIEEETIKEWVEEVKLQLLKKRSKKCYNMFIASGNTLVYGVITKISKKEAIVRIFVTDSYEEYQRTIKRK